MRTMFPQERQSNIFSGMIFSMNVQSTGQQYSEHGNKGNWSLLAESHWTLVSKVCMCKAVIQCQTRLKSSVSANTGVTCFSDTEDTQCSGNSNNGGYFQEFVIKPTYIRQNLVLTDDREICAGLTWD